MKIFKVNEYITLKLEDGKTNIYIKGNLFQQCKFLLINIPVDKISSFDEIDSIDEAAEKLDRFLEGPEESKIEILPEVEFWGHCSNLQVWAEMNYDTRLIHSTLAFPLLKKLVDIEDPKAKVVFKEEIVKRLENGYTPVIEFLYYENYLDYLDKGDIDFNLFMNIIKIFKGIEINPEEIELFINRVEVQNNLGFFKKFIINLREFDVAIRKYIYFLILRKPKSKDLLIDCLEQLAEANEYELMYFFIMDYLRRDITEIPKFRNLITENMLSQKEILNVLKKADLNEIFIVISLNLITRTFSKEDIKNFLVDPSLKLIENFALAWRLNKITEDHQIYSDQLDSDNVDWDKTKKDIELEFEEYYFEDNRKEKDGIFRYFPFFEEMQDTIKEYKEDFCKFFSKHYPNLFKNTLFSLLKDGIDEVIESLIDNCFLDYLPIKRVIKFLELRPERLEQLYCLFRELLFEINMETMLRENFYEEQGDFFIELGKNFTPILKDTLAKILSNNKEYDFTCFENLGWSTTFSESIYNFEKAQVPDPHNYRKLDEW